MKDILPMKNSAWRLVTVAILSTWVVPAHAYLDPGTGSMLIQGLIGAIAAVSVTLRLYWHKIKAAFGGEASDADEVDEIAAERVAEDVNGEGRSEPGETLSKD
jgi:hypothetical protein